MAYETNVQRELDKIYLGQLPIIGAVVFVYYSLLTVLHFFFLSKEILLPIAGTSGVTAISGLLLWHLIKKQHLKADQSHQAFIPVALFVLTTIYAHVWFSQEQHQLTNAILAQYALSLVILSPRIFTILSLLCSGAFIVMLMAVPGPLTAHFGLMLAAAVLLSVLGFLLRYRALYKSVRLLTGSRRKTRSLSAATRQIKTKMIEAQEANAARDVFLANVTHELRTPLTGVLGMLDLLSDNDLDKDQKFMVATAQKSANFLLHIINDLLDFAKLEAGKLELNLAPVDIVALTHDVVATFQGEAKQKGLTLTFLKQGDIPGHIRGDGGRIGQMLLNLVSNAVKFTEKGSVIVTLRYSTANHAIWTVKDTGCGIAPDHQAKLFKRFEQLDPSVTRPTSGTGLGLAIVHELTQLYGGTVAVDSTEGYGSEFVLCLPLAAVTEARQISSNDNDPQEEFSLAHLELRILVAEDNDINQILIRKIMEKLGVELKLVGDGAQAVEAATSTADPFDLILMDVQMPVMDGIEATRKIIKQLKSPPPIIAITANTMEADLERYQQIGMADSIGKPINMDALRACIVRFAQK